MVLIREYKRLLIEDIFTLSKLQGANVSLQAMAIEWVILIPRNVLDGWTHFYQHLVSRQPGSQAASSQVN